MAKGAFGWAGFEGEDGEVVPLCGDHQRRVAVGRGDDLRGVVERGEDLHGAHRALLQLDDADAVGAEGAVVGDERPLAVGHHAGVGHDGVVVREGDGAGHEGRRPAPVEEVRVGDRSREHHLAEEETCGAGLACGKAGR
jgi:hypothetical protein